MNALNYLPLDTRWLLESRAYTSSSPRLVRAAIMLLEGAWRASPAGTLPTDFAALACIAGLTEGELVEHHDELLDQWKLIDGRLRFEPMFALCERITARHGDALDELAARAVVVAQAPEDFELVAPEAIVTTRGRHRIPKSWRISDALKRWLSAQGIENAEDQSFIETKFTTHYGSKGEQMLDWDKAFQNFALKENRGNLPSAQRTTPSFAPTGRAARFGQAGEAAREGNAGAFSRATSRVVGEAARG